MSQYSDALNIRSRGTGPRRLPTKLNNLTDVDTANALAGQALVYNASLQIWEPGTVSSLSNIDGGHSNTVFGGMDPIDGGYA